MNYADALEHCKRAHAGQVDKSGTDYWLHPLRVSRIVLPLGEDFAVVAVLHDVLEDTDYVLGDKGLTPRQQDAVGAITQLPEEHYKVYIARCSENFIARVVKIADIRHNLSTERMRGLNDSMRERYNGALEVLLGGTS